MRSGLRALLAALLGLAALLAACGGDDGVDAAAESSTTTTERTTTTRPAPTTTTSTSTTTTTTATTVAPAVDPTTTVTRGSTVTAAPAPTAPPPAYRSRISTVTAEDLYASWRPGCPVPPDQLRAIDLTHWGFDGAIHEGRLVVIATEASDIAAVFGDLYGARYPIQRIQPIDVYGGDDNRSIKANNTSAFNCRAVTGGSGWSEHAFGRALDLNPFVNPYVKGSTVLPPEAAKYTDRSRNDPGMIHAGDATVQAFAARGWKWGGYWSSLKDYQHFSTTGK